MREEPVARTSGLLLLENPKMEEVVGFLQDSFRRKDLVIIVGDCECKYSGRASSSLGHGERVVLIKGDGSVQVHRPTGYEPVNWQPARCILSVSLEGSSLSIKAHRSRPRETLDTIFSSLIFIASIRLMDRAEFSLYVSEEQMRDALVSDPSILEDGLRLIDFERRVEPGFIDFYGKDAQGRFVVVELKRTPAGKDAILQLKRYVDVVNETTGLSVRGVVAAPSLRSGAQRILATLGLEFKRLSPRRCAKLLQKRETRKISEFFRAP